jgi:Zn-dependent protease
LSIDLIPTILGFVVFIFSIIVHENAHGVAANYFGDPTALYSGRITLNPIPHIDPVGSVLLPAVALTSGVPFLGWAKPVPVNPANLRNPLVHNAYVAAAGPASNFMLAFLGAFLWIIVGLVFKHIPALNAADSRSLLFFNMLCNNLITYNCVLGIFNLLPIPPLDGHWILIRFLPPGAREAVASVGRFGFLILIGLLWTGILWRIITLPLTLAVSGYHSLVNTALRWL